MLMKQFIDESVIDRVYSKKSGTQMMKYYSRNRNKRDMK